MYPYRGYTFCSRESVSPRDTHVFRDRALAMEMAPVALSVAPALQEAAASGIWMQELSHPLMGLLCRAGDHPRQPAPHAACCCCAGRDRLAAGVRCSWRSRLGVVSCLTRPSSGVQWPVPPPSEEGVEVAAAKERIRGRQGLEETRLPQSADACLQPFSTH